MAKIHLQARSYRSKFALAGCTLALALSLIDVASAAPPRGARWEDLAQSREAGPPIFAIVALRQQRITVYDAEGKILRAPVSTGRRGYDTPSGVFSILERKVEHYSNLYFDASMPYMQRLTWSGIALHEGALPGYPASHGCIRLPSGFAQHLFEMTKRGTRVIIVDNDTAPMSISHAALFQPLPENVTVPAVPTAVATSSDSQSTGPRKRPAVLAAETASTAEAATKAATQARMQARAKTVEAARLIKTHRIAVAAHARAVAELQNADRQAFRSTNSNAEAAAERTVAAAENKLVELEERVVSAASQLAGANVAAEELRAVAATAEAERAAAADAAKEAAANAAPASVFISRKLGKLFVRQVFNPRFDGEISIARPDEPLGTYVFTAVDGGGSGQPIRWNVVAIKTPNGQAPERTKSEKASLARQMSSSDTETAARAALDRISIAPELLEKVSELIQPGSSIIITDDGMSSETGTGTDFIVTFGGAPSQIAGSRPNRTPRIERPRPYVAGGGLFSWW